MKRESRTTFRQLSIALVVYLLAILATPAIALIPSFDALEDIRSQVTPRFTYSKNVLAGILVVKTKLTRSTTNDGLNIVSDYLSASLSKLGVTSITKPFQTFDRKGNSVSQKAMIQIGLERVFFIRYSNPIDPVDVANDIQSNLDVEYAEPLYSQDLCFTPNDPHYNNNQYALRLMQADKAWDITKGDSNVKIAIVDSGTFWSHEDLATNIWVNTADPINGRDDDANGKIDDFRGWDFVGNVSASQVSQGQLLPDNDPSVPANAVDGRGHGTHIAGCASAVTNNGKGVASLGYMCKLMPIKCGSDDPAVGNIFGGYEAMLYASTMGADVINCSWGRPGSYSQFEQDVVNQTVANGAIVVVAAGNDGRFMGDGTYFPACYDNVLCVGASDQNDRVANYSNYGRQVDVYAPGTAITSTLPGNNYVVNNGNWSGTSMASPIVAGLVGLVKSKNPTWTRQQIEAQIRQTSDNVLTTDPTKRSWYFGRANAFRAVSESVPSLTVQSISIDGANALTDYNPHTAKFTIKNLLAASSAGQMTITLLDSIPNASLTTTSVPLSVVPTEGSVDVNVPIQLLSSCPWYSGNVHLMLTITAGTYLDYLNVTIPINVASSNRYYSLSNFRTPVEVHSLSAYKAGNAWGTYAQPISATASDGYVFLASGGAIGQPVRVTSQPFYYIEGLDDTHAFASTGVSGTGSGSSRVFRTSNGTTWQSADVSGTTPFVNNLRFFDLMNGVLLGDPLAGKFGVATTTNGGVAWLKSTTAPSSQSAEIAYNTGTCWLGDKVWFGTSLGRVLSSPDRGITWTSRTAVTGLPIVHVGFRDSLNGIIVYRNSAATTAKYLGAATSDGGRTWQSNLVDFSAMKLIPTGLFYPKDSKQAFVLCSNGSVYGTEDNGATWAFVLSQESFLSTSGAAWVGKVSFADKVRIWNGGGGVGFLDIPFKTTVVKKELKSTLSALDFGSKNIGDSLTKSFQLQNSGDVDVIVTSVTLQGTDATSFSILTPFVVPFTMKSKAIQDIQIQFKPSKQADLTATCTTVSDASATAIVVNLSGKGTNPASVENDLSTSISLFPNPANSELFVTFPETLSIEELSITDLLGNRVLVHNLDFKTGERTSLTVKTDAIANGNYLLNFRANGTTIVRGFTILR